MVPPVLFRFIQPDGTCESLTAEGTKKPAEPRCPLIRPDDR